jgi:hypothetical protein
MRLFLAQAVVYAFVPLVLAGLVPVGVSSTAVSLQPPATSTDSPWAVFAAPGKLEASRFFEI